MGCTVSLNYELKPPSFKLLLSGYFVSVTGKETMTVGDLPEFYTAPIRMMDRRSNEGSHGMILFMNCLITVLGSSPGPPARHIAVYHFYHLSQCWQVFGEDGLPGAVPCLHVLLTIASHSLHCRLRILCTSQVFPSSEFFKTQIIHFVDEETGSQRVRV